MITHKVVKNEALVNVVQNRLTFNSHREFRSAVNTVINSPGVDIVNVDMAAVDYIDSATLGMFLITREAAEAKNARVRILNCRIVVKQILEIASFQKLFDIT